MAEQVGWCVVISKPMSEHIAFKSLRQGGYRPYLPMEQKIMRGHRENKGQPVLRPLFPRYLFAELHPGQQWGPIMRSSGVNNIIKDGERPALLSPDVIEAVREAERHEMFDERHIPRPIPIGTTVRIEDGPFRDLFGCVMAASENDRIRVFLSSVMGGAPANFKREQLEVVA